MMGPIGWTTVARTSPTGPVKRKARGASLSVADAAEVGRSGAAEPARQAEDRREASDEGFSRGRGRVTPAVLAALLQLRLGG